MARPRRSGASARRAQAPRRSAAKQAPAPMTQDEVDAMTAGGAPARAVSRRLRRGPSPAAAGRFGSDKAGPESVSDVELTALRGSGAAATRFRDRLPASEPPSGPPPARQPARKAAPTESPPTGPER